MTSFTDTGKAMYALCWADRKHKMLISNRGTILAGTESIRVRHRTIVRNGKMETKQCEKRVSRRQMVEFFLASF
ncbi:hypothetical protein JG687_00011832 [Phytophthora cactorum]|uniref:PiggyBac transposable element-derived protein domain-containing protein n=1 Tax=Phytophthora cactorum TaxID=29920 RepID=A0A8T1U5G0_9STRA|nr:hypothetical protein JG687_00011832 [Phytophthora cactorum]